MSYTAMQEIFLDNLKALKSEKLKCNVKNTFNIDIDSLQECFDMMSLVGFLMARCITGTSTRTFFNG